MWRDVPAFVRMRFSFRVRLTTSRYFGSFKIVNISNTHAVLKVNTRFLTITKQSAESINQIFKVNKTANGAF